MFAVVEYVKEVTCKKSCKYGKYGSFEHLLFLFIIDPEGHVEDGDLKYGSYGCLMCTA